MKHALPSLKRLFSLPAARWAAGYLALQACMVALVYYWRVFYGWGGSAFKMTGLCCLIATGVFAAVWLICTFAKTFAARTAWVVLLCGTFFCFANPPLQAPDEVVHYQRSYAISMGRFDFDYDRGYPADVNALLESFPGAWTNAITSYWASEDPVTGDVVDAGSSANYPIKVRGDHREWIGLQFEEYQKLKTQNIDNAHEPVMFQILPFLPQAAGMAVGRLFGLDALGCLYAGRLANLAVYAGLCWLALRNCKRYQPLFAAVMLLPLSLYLAASLSYDAMLLGLYYLTASYYCADEIKTKDLAVFLAAFVLMNAVKPWISLLWLALPLVLPKKAWKTKVRKWQLAGVALIAALAATLFVEWYGRAMRFNYPEIGRMLGSDVNGGQQLAFVLSNIPRTIMVFIGTLYENCLFLGQLGTFGMLDLELPMVQLLSLLVLCLGTALSVHEKSSLTPRSAIGLGALAVCYMGGVMGALYITYTPVGMARVLGLQARYFLPSFLMLFVLLAALLSHVLEPRLAMGGQKAGRLALWTSGGAALLSAVLLAQHYFIGPAYVMP